MEAKSLHVWICNKCKNMYINKDDAERCCSPGICDTCGKPTENWYIHECDECFEKRVWEHASSKMPLSLYINQAECTCLYWRHEYYDTVDELIEANGGEFPKHGVYGCYYDIAGINPDDIIDYLIDKDDFSCVPKDGIDMIYDFADRFNEEFAVPLIEPDTTLAIYLDENGSNNG